MADVIYADFVTKTYHKPGEDIGDVVGRIEGFVTRWLEDDGVRDALQRRPMPKVAPDYGCSDVAYVAPAQDPA